MRTLIDRLARRHGTRPWQAPFHELFTRAYQTPVRPLLRGAFGRKEPSGLVFVVGCYNSGTTLYRDLFSIHPLAGGPPVEGDLLTGHLGTLEDGGYPRGMYANADTVIAAERRRRVDRDTLLSDWRPWIADGRLLVEKSVSNSMRILGLREAFPEARFVWVVRDPFEVAEGIRRRSRPRGGAAYTVEFLLRQWLFFNRTIAEDADPGRTLECTYGRLLADPAGVARRAFDFADLPDVDLDVTSTGLRVDTRVLPIRGIRSESCTAGSPADDRARWTARVEAALGTPDPDVARFDPPIQ